MKKPGLFDLFMTGVLLGVLVLLGYEILAPGDVFVYVITLWSMSILTGYFMLRAGFDYYRVKYSFSLMFFSIIIVLYEVLVLIIFLIFSSEEVFRDTLSINVAVAVALTPYLSTVISGYISEKIKSFKSFKELVGVKPVTGFNSSIRRILYQLDKTMWFFFSFGSVYLVLFMLIPIVLVLIYSLIPPAGGSWWDNFYNALRQNIRLQPLVASPWSEIRLPTGECMIVFKGVNYGPVLNSIITASIVTTIATLLGVVIGYVLARYRFPGHMLLRIMAIIPLFNTPFINAFAIKLLWSENGPVSYLFKSLTGCYLRIESIVGVIVTQILTFYPIVYLNAYTAFINVDPSTEEQAENLGAKGFRIFRTVTLPLALPGIAAGATLVFVFSLEDLMAPIVFNEKNYMSRRIFDELMTTYIYGFVRPEVAALGVLMLIYALVVFIAIRNYVSMRSYAMISRGGRWNPRTRNLGIPGLIVVYSLVLPLVLFTMTPQVMVILMSLGVLKPYRGEAGLVLDIPSDPFRYFIRILMDPAVNRFIANTLIYAGISVTIAVFLATSIAYSVSRLKIRAIPGILDSLATSPLAIPGLVFALGYYILFTEISRYIPREIALYISPVSPAFQAWLVFIVSYSVRRLPYVVRSVYAGFQQVHENLEEAAMNLGAPRYRVVFGVIMPYIVGYVLSGALLGFIYMATEVSTSVTFGGIREDQAPLTYYMMMTLTGAAGEGPFLVAAMGSLLIIIQLIVVSMIIYVFKQRYAFIGV